MSATSNLKKILFLFVLFPLLFTASFAYSIKVAKIVVNAPKQVNTGQDFTATVNIQFQATKDWHDVCFGPFVVSCPIGIYLKYSWAGAEYRIGDQGTTNPNVRNTYPYAFDGSTFTKTVTLKLKAPNTPSTQYLYVELKIDETNDFDEVLKSVKVPIVVSKPSEEELSSQTPSVSPQIPTNCKFSNIRIYTVPLNPIEDRQATLYFEADMDCPRYSGGHGPYFKIYIIGPKQYNVYRLGDQGYTDATKIIEENYYFEPGKRHVKVAIPYVFEDPGTYRIDIEIKKEKTLAPDETIYSKDRFTTILVKRQEEATLEETGGKITECTKKPQLYIASWQNEDGKFTRTVRANENVYAYVVIKNPSESCSYHGGITVEIRKDVTGPDIILKRFSNEYYIGPKDEKTTKVSFVPSDEGEYHYDVYWNGVKYSRTEVYKPIFSNSGDYASDDLIVKKSIDKALEEKPSEVITVQEYWFESNGTKVVEVPEGSPIKACVKVVSPTTVSGKLKVEVKRHSGIQSLGMVGDLPPDIVQTSKVFDVVLEKDTPRVYCVETTAIQSSSLHNERYYIAAYWNDKELGIFPPTKSGLTVIPKNAGLNPFIKDLGETGQVTVLEHGWYDAQGNRVDNKDVWGGTYYVKAKLLNSAPYVINGTGKIVIRYERDLNFDENYKVCPFSYSIGPGQTKEVSCEVYLSDGKYHYEIWILGKKVINEGPRVYVGLAGSLWRIVYDGFLKGVILNPFTIIGTIVIIIIIGFLVFVALSTAHLWLPLLIETTIYRYRRK